MDPIDPSEIPLRDIHLPEAISWWPPAFGWWIVIAIIVIISVLAWLYFRSKPRNNRRKILQSLDTIEQEFMTHRDHHRLAKQLSMLARQVSLLELEDNDPQRGLVGPAWSQSWQQRLGTGTLSEEQLANALNVAPYRDKEQIDGANLIAAFRQSVSVASSKTVKSLS